MQNVKKTSSIYDMPEDLNDASAVTSNVKAVYDRYQDYLDSTITASTSADILVHNAIFYVEAVYNAINYNIDYEVTDIDASGLHEDSYSLNATSENSRWYLSEADLFTWLDNLGLFSFSGNQAVAPITNVFWDDSDGTRLTFGINRIPIRLSCSQRKIQATDEARAKPSPEDCLGNPITYNATKIMELSMDVNCPVKEHALLWYYSVEDYGFLYSQNYRLWVRGFYSNGIPYDFYPGSSTQYTSNFFVGAPNTCLDNVDLEFWRDKAESAMLAEEVHVNGVARYALMSSVNLSGQNTGNVAHQLTVGYAVPGGLTPTFP